MEKNVHQVYTNQKKLGNFIMPERQHFNKLLNIKSIAT